VANAVGGAGAVSVPSSRGGAIVSLIVSRLGPGEAGTGARE
jgi:hypothetical protein